jgi:hypothetical protein
MWSEIECLVGIVAGCLATLRPILRVLGFSTDSATSQSSKPSLGHRLHSIKSKKRSNGSGLDSTYQVIVETERGRKEEENASDTGSQKGILAEGGLRIYKGREVDVKSEALERV